LYPESLRSQIDSIAAWIVRDLNRGVYKAGNSGTQEEYDNNVIPVFGALNRLERLIHENGGPYVLGKQITELDILLYPTLIRFDTVYVQHFKLNLGTIRHEYPVLNHWLTHLYWRVPGFKETTDFRHIKENVSLFLHLAEKEVLITLAVYQIPLRHQPQGHHTERPFSACDRLRRGRLEGSEGRQRSNTGGVGV
jgi:glutathionyl-hydroquinone reductase